MSYQKNSWSDGDIITAGKLNNIENGVESVETNVTQATSDISTLSNRVTALEESSEEGSTPADYQELVDDVSSLKADFSDFADEKTSAAPVADWEQGEFSTTTGAEIRATNRIRTVKSGIPANVKSINAINGYKFLMYAWSENEYLGIWDGTGFNKTSASGLIITTLDLKPVYTAGAKKMRIVLMRSNGSETIAPAEGVNVVYIVYENFIPTLKDELNSIDEFIDDVKILYQKGNVYQAKTDEVNNRYYYRSSGALKVGINTDYISFIVPVIPNRTYTFVRSNILLLKEDKTLLITEGGNYDVAGVRTCYSGNAHYFAVSVRREDIPSNGYVLSMGNSIDESNYSLSVYANPVPPKRILDANMVSGALADGETHIIYGKSGIRDGYYAAFLGKFDVFTTVSLKFNGYNVTNAISVDATNLVITSGIGNAITQPHGLTIEHEVAILLELKNSVMYVTIESGGVKYQNHYNWYWTGSSISEIGVTALNMEFTSTRLSIKFKSAERPVWYFGDSYSEFNMESRLPYYVIEYGFDKNIMFNSVSGSSSTAANESFVTLLAYGNPKYAIYALGMNDGSDTNDTTPNATWLNNIQTFISICQRSDITPVLCTVPTIPTVNNNGKNAWVKTSGYRYIDMAGAVGADTSGNWYSGMLSNDNIHPSPLGAIAQFMQLLTDMPEVMG